jgi:hypothetical protein
VKNFSGPLAFLLLVAVSAWAGDQSWRGEITEPGPRKFPSLPGLRMEFRFGWSNVLEAAEAKATIQKVHGKYRAQVRGGTKGLARMLWPLDASHSAILSVDPLRPGSTNQIERYRSRTIETQVRFDATGLKRLRKTSDSRNADRWKRVNFAPIFDVIGGVLFVRSQPLNIGDTVGLVCFPGDSPYIAVVHVVKREKVRCMGRDWPALRLSLTVRKLEVKKKSPTNAVKYAKFRSGTFWVSDDALRIPLRAEVNVMVGFVYGELTDFKRLD